MAFYFMFFEETKLKKLCTLLVNSTGIYYPCKHFAMPQRIL